MATPDRDNVYGTDNPNRAIYTRESNSTGWFVGIVVALALLAIAYLVFSANSQPSTSTTVNNTPAVTAPADNGTGTTTTPMAPADNGAATTTTPAAPAATAPADTTSAAPSAPATDSAASSAVAPASSAQ